MSAAHECVHLVVVDMGGSVEAEVYGFNEAEVAVAAKLAGAGRALADALEEAHRWFAAGLMPIRKHREETLDRIALALRAAGRLP